MSMSYHKRKVDDLNTDATKVVPPTEILRAPILGQYFTYVDRSKLTTTPLKFATPTVNSRTYNKPVHKYLNVKGVANKGVANKGVANSNLNATVPIDPMFDTQNVLEHTTSNIEVEDREGFVDKNDLGSAEYNVITSGYGAKTEKSGVTIDRLEEQERQALKEPEVPFPQYDLIINTEYEINTSTSISDPECSIEYTWEKDGHWLFLNSINCAKEEGGEGGKGSKLALNTILALKELGKGFTTIKLMPVAGLDPKRPVDLKNLVATYKTWGFGDLNPTTGEQTGSLSNIVVTLKAKIANKAPDIKRQRIFFGGSRKTKKTKKRKQRKTKTKRKQSGNKRRQTKKRGKR